MESTEALIMDWYPAMSQAWHLTHPSGLLSGRRAGATFTPLTSEPNILFLRRNNGDPNVLVNVFDTHGNKAYTIERQSRLATLWTVYEAGSRRQVALIKCGILMRTCSFMNKPGIQTREIGRHRWLYGGLPDYRFYLSDGAPLEWTRHSQYLERNVNPGGGPEETRQRLARARLLRPGRFDYELLVDPKFDREIALATAFNSMLTEWSVLHMAIPGTRTGFQ